MELRTFLVICAWVWGSYYYVQFKRLERSAGKPSTKTTHDGYRVNYIDHKKPVHLDVPSAKTDKDALRYAVSKGVDFQKITSIEKL